MRGKRNGGLGRNLDALLGKTSNLVVKTSATDNKQQLRQLPIDTLQRGKYQPRSIMEPAALQELAQSIKAQGIIQPIVVRPIGNNHYEIIAGERRWRAAQLAGLKEVPVTINDIPDEAALAVALIENIQRENLNPIEEARALQRLLKDFDFTHQQVAEAVGKSRTTVTNLLRLMQLDDTVKTMLEQGKLEMGHARALLSLDTSSQIHVAKTVISKRLSVRATERLVQTLQQNTNHPSIPISSTIDPDIKQLQDKLAERLGAKVTIQHQSLGKGKLIIEYHSVDELEGIISHLQEKHS